MALKTVANLKDSVAGMLSGISLGTVENLNGALERAARCLVQQADIPEASGTQNIVLYNGVYDYLCDSRVFGTAINDIRPQGVSRSINNFVYKNNGADFDRTKGYLPSGSRFTFEYINGSPIIRIDSNMTIQRVIVDNMNDATDWVAGGTIANVSTDRAVYYQTPASLRFNLTGSGSGTLTKTLPNPIDMSSYEGVGVAFMAIRIPDGADVSNLTSIALKIGSGASDYATVTDTEGFLGAWVSGEWLLVAFDFASAADTGTPNWENIDYVQPVFNHTGTFTNFRIGGLWFSQPFPAQILYQSAAIFKASGSQASTSITDDNDEILLNDAAYTLYEIESAKTILQQTGSTEGNPMYQTFKTDLHGNGTTDSGLYVKYRGDNPSQEIRQVGRWY